MTRIEAIEAIKEAYGNSEYTDEIIEALKHETVTEFADRCRECGAEYGKLKHNLEQRIETQRQNLARVQEYSSIVKQENNELYKKIDNAIDDIEDLEKIELSCSDLGGDVGSSWFVCLDEVLEILRNI